MYKILESKSLENLNLNSQLIYQKYKSFTPVLHIVSFKNKTRLRYFDVSCGYIQLVVGEGGLWGRGGCGGWGVRIFFSG
jgi:hypothetical protein